MSVIFKNYTGFYISHKAYVDKLYADINKQQFLLNSTLFHIKRPYKTAKNKTVTNKKIQEIKNKFNEFLQDLKSNNIFLCSNTNSDGDYALPLDRANIIYKESAQHSAINAFGCNSGPAKKEIINNASFLFPENSKFYSKDVKEISTLLKNETYDFILLDPPWWNKFIRRKRKKTDTNDGYSMLYNEDLKSLPIENLINKNSLVAVWCTNSQQNIDDLIKTIFPKWKLQLISQWYWVKVTTNGDTICEFGEPPQKQPFERIIFGAAENRQPVFPKEEKIIVSVPSALHSHKPPLSEVMEPYLPPNPKCLEIFARYLLPEWTSYGNEVLRFQHESVFECK